MRESLGRYFWLGWVAVMAWCLYRLLVNEAWILDDEIAHYLISKGAWDDASQLWHPWSRPGRNLLHFIPAHFGLTAARVWTLALAGLALWMTGREGRRLGMKGLWALPLLVGFQWWFPELSYPVLTQTPFMVVWIAGVFFAMRNRLALAAVCFGYLGLVRHEGIALTGLWGLWVIFAEDGFARMLVQRKWGEARSAFPRAVWLGMWTILPMVVMNVATGLTRGEWPVMMFFESKPTEMYGSGPLWLYCQHLATGAGIPVLILMLIGVFKKGWDWNWDLVLYATYPAYFVLHSVIFWKGMFASGGYYHFIMPMAPFVGLVALRGFNVVRARAPKWVVVLTLVAVVWGGLLMPQQQFIMGDSHIEGMPKAANTLKPIAPPMRQSRFGQGLKDAAQWMRENGEGERWLGHHTAVDFWLQDEEVGEVLSVWDDRTPENLEPGTLLIWDAQYSVQETFGFTEERIEAAGYDELQRWAHGTVRIYRKR
ncbi:MAG: hypothetical protein ACSHYF_07775 [Verrucomicrobiaceae bacterium]